LIAYFIGTVRCLPKNIKIRSYSVKSYSKHSWDVFCDMVYYSIQREEFVLCKSHRQLTGWSPYWARPLKLNSQNLTTALFSSFSQLWTLKGIALIAIVFCLSYQILCFAGRGWWWHRSRCCIQHIK